MSRQSVRYKVLSRILEFEPGQPIAYGELKGYGFDSSTQRWLKHFCEIGTITRVMIGFYARPIGRLFQALQALNPETTQPVMLARALKLLGRSGHEVENDISMLLSEPLLKKWTSGLQAALELIR